MRVAKAKGRLRGKQPKLNRRQERPLVSLVHSGDYTIAEVADLIGVGRPTVYQADAAPSKPATARGSCWGRAMRDSVPIQAEEPTRHAMMQIA